MLLLNFILLIFLFYSISIIRMHFKGFIIALENYIAIYYLLMTFSLKV